NNRETLRPSLPKPLPRGDPRRRSTIWNQARQTRGAVALSLSVITESWTCDTLPHVLDLPAMLVDSYSGRWRYLCAIFLNHQHRTTTVRRCGCRHRHPLVKVRGRVDGSGCRESGAQVKAMRFAAATALVSA